MATRPIAKGLGARPTSLAWGQFIELIARVWPFITAAREGRISRSAAYIRRAGVTVRDKKGTM